jgi:trans-aconitate 2-methyltransferase
MMGYEFDGEKYRKAAIHQKEWGERLIAETTLTGFESILDLGCGDGIITEMLSRLVPKGRVIGIDASPGMIKIAQKYSCRNLMFILVDINLMDFKNEFDLIISNAALHWILEHGKLLENCFRALKNGGKIRFNFAGEGNCSNFNAVVKDMMLMDDYAVHFHDFTWPWYMPSIEEYKKIITKTNFKNIEVWEENADRFFPNEEIMTKWIDQPSIVPFLRNLPKEKKQGFRNAVVYKMIDRTKQKDGSYFETFRRINVSARK